MKPLADLPWKILLFLLAGFLTAVASFVFQVFLSGTPLIGFVNNLLVFAFLEESLKLFFFRGAWGLACPPDKREVLKMFFFSLVFALGFWLLEMIFLKLKTSFWPISLSAFILLLVHWLTTWLVANSNQKLSRKKYWTFLLFFLFSLTFHFSYNFLIAKGVF